MKKHTMIDTTSIFDSPNLNDRIQIAQIRHLRINTDDPKYANMLRLLNDND